MSAPPQFNGGTIQPSAFSSWHNDPRRDVSSEVAGADEDRSTERRPSISSASEKWETKASPASVEVSDNGSDYVDTVTPTRKKAKKAEPAPVPVKIEEVVEGSVTFTTDCEVKQTPTVSYTGCSMLTIDQKALP